MYKISQNGTHLPQVVVVLILMLSAMLGSILVTQAQYDDQLGVSNLISLDVVDADLSKVVLMLARDSKQSIVIADQDKMHNKVTATLKDMPLETALRYIVESVGCAFRRAPDGVYVIGGKSKSGLSEGVGVPRDDGMAAAQSNSYKARGETKVDVIKLNNASPIEIMRTLGLLEDHWEKQETEKSGFKPGVYREKANGEIETIMQGMEDTPPLTESLKAYTGSAERAPDLGNESQQFPRSGSGYTNQQRNTGNITGRQPGQTGQVPGGGTGTGGGLVPEGIETIMPYQLDNSLIVRGDQEGIEELKTIIRQLDIAPRQIMIKSEFVAMSTNDIHNLGINWSIERLNSSFATSFKTTASSEHSIGIGYANGNIMANLKAQISIGNGKVIRAPVISTMNNMPAYISDSTGVPYQESTIIYNQNNTPSSSSVTRVVYVTSVLQVTPRINNADDSITVQISPQIQDINGEPEAGEYPIIENHSLTTTRRVQNGETIVLGGFIRKSTTENVDKVPFLGDLPFIGSLFRNTSTKVNDTEILIFLTPTIIPEKPIAGMGIGVAL